MATFINAIKNTIKNTINNQHGSALVLVSFALVGLLAITGLVLDGGTLYVTKSHLQKTANAAVLSGAQELTNSDNSVTEVVNQVLNAHDEAESLETINIAMNNQVSVQLSKEVQQSLSKIFGKDTVQVNVEATAQLGSIGKAVGVAPLGIDDSIELEYYTTYKLKVDQSEVSHGNFGILALGGPGANRYEDNLLYGYQSEISVGDVIDTQTGNIAGKTRSSIKARIDACPYQEYDEDNHRDCSRVILLPVYTPHNHNKNQLKEVRVTGFAYFYIMEPMSSKDTSITGMFIKRAGKGTIEPTAVDKGAYSIRLIK